MKTSKLLATTALVASATAFAAAPASAAKLSLGGFFEQWAGFASSGEKAATTEPHSDFDLQQDSEIFFNYKEKLSNGLTVGGRFEMESQEDKSGSGDKRFDEVSMYVSGAFGKIQAGSNDVAATMIGGVSVVGPIGIIKSDIVKWLPGMTSGPSIHMDNDLNMGDEQNIMYVSPKMNGLQLAVSHTPESGGAADRATTGFTDGFSTMVKYGAKMGGASVTVGVGYTSNTSAPSSGTDQDGTNLAIKVASGPLTFTAGWKKEDFASTDESFAGAGLMYKLDKVNTISIGYGNHETKTDSSGATKDDTVISLGYARNLGKGVTFAASLAHGEYEDSATPANDADGVAAVAGFAVKF